ncbi:MAG: hypothetical protein IKM32_06945 [Clostridia bacterium]|nr:hypothetical protein [Clostridia bacterium]
MKKFLNAVGQIDDELLDRYEKIEKMHLPQKKNRRILKTVAIAACFCIIIGSLIAVLSFGGNTDIPHYSNITSVFESFEGDNPSSRMPNESSNVISEAVSDPEQSETSNTTSQGGNTSQSVESSQPDESSHGDVSGGETSVPIPPTELNHTLSNEPLWVNPAIAANGNSSGAQQAEPAPPYVLFGMGMTAVGKVQQILPDTYARLGASTAEPRYRVIVMEITESVYGKNLPSEIYLTVPSYLDVNALLNYDQILFAFKQKGFENYVLANETQKRAEAFSMMFETVPGYHEFCFVPFTDGVLDISLWREKGWKNRLYKEKYLLEFFDDRDNFLVMSGDTLEQAKKNVLNYLSDMYHTPLDRVLYSEIFAYDEAKEVLAHCKPFENGIYSQEAYVQNGSAIFFERCIYGFATNEMIRISEKDGDVTYYGEAFTEEEIAMLPNIAAFFENTNLDSLSPMHTDIPNSFETSKPMLSGKYIKHGGKIYSVARVAWRMTGELNNESGYYLDDSYFIISEDGSATLIEREELRTLTGDDTFITNFTYNEFLPTVYE